MSYANYGHIYDAFMHWSRNIRLSGFREDPASILCSQEGNLKVMPSLSSLPLPSQQLVLAYESISENEIFSSVDWHLSLRSKGTLPLHTRTENNGQKFQVHCHI